MKVVADTNVLLRDALHGRLKTFYDVVDKPDLSEAIELLADFQARGAIGGFT